MPVLCPQRWVESVTEIDPKALWDSGFRAVLLDLDNTLVPWQGSDIAPQRRAWVEDLKQMGFKLCLVSNTRHGRRLVHLSQVFGIPYVKRAWKPRKKGFRDALELLGCRPEETCMVGDQMFTDVLGGNRMGLFTIMVRPMARREFLGTKISRAAEWALLRHYRRTGRMS